MPKLLTAAAGTADRAPAPTTEAAASAAKTSPAESASAPTAAAHRAGDQRGDPPAAAASATAPGATAARHYRVQNENDDSQDEKPQQTTGIPLTGATGPGSGRWRAAERDAAILSDYVGDAAGQQRHGCVVIPLPEIWDRFAAKAADFTVGQDGFQAVADLRPVFVIVHGQEYENAAGGLLRTYTPFGGYV